MSSSNQHQAQNIQLGAAPQQLQANNQTGGNIRQGNTAPQHPQGPYMVLTQVALPAHMVSQLSGGGGVPNAGSTPQILSFNQLPQQVQAQILMQQSQMQNQLQSSSACNQQQQQQALQPDRIQTSNSANSETGQQPQQPLNANVSNANQAKNKTFTMADVQGLLKNNQLNASAMQQLLATGSSSAGSGHSNSNQGSLHENSLSDLFNSFNDASESKDTSSDVSNTNKRLFLETQVQPVQRQNDAYNDDDLFKFFELDGGEELAGTGGEDFLNQTSDIGATSKKSTEAQLNSQLHNLSSLLEPTPLFQTLPNPTQPQAQPSTQNTAPAQVSSSDTTAQPPQPSQAMSLNSSDQQQLQRRRLQQQQLQRQPQHMPIAVPSQPQAPQPAGVGQQNRGANNPTFSLPSTMVPPTVLASVCTGKTERKRTPLPTASKKTSNKRVKRVDNLQDFLMQLVEKHGHTDDLQRIKSEDAGYDTMPSPLQLSSFGTQVVHAVHTSDDEMLGKLLSCGLSPNPCNQFRDSILDLVCKRNNVAIFKCLLEHGSDIRVVDGFGRTPLHHCGWASDFSREIAEAILERDPLQLFIEDKRGQTPMEYVRPGIAAEWSEFLEEMAEKHWPRGGPVPTLTRPKDSRPDGTLPDPKNAISAGLASMISSGNITVEQYEEMDEATKKSYG